MRQRISTALGGVLVLGAMAVLGGCGSAAISADTTCEEYLQQPHGARHDAAVRLSSELGVSSAGNPMWGLSLDQACGNAPSQTIGEYFERVQ